MWDLDTIRWMNERAHNSSLKMINEGLDLAEQPTTPENEPAEPAEPVFPLAFLARRLIIGPPSLARLVDLLESSDSIAYFLELVREYLPEHEGEIMAVVDDRTRIERFHRLFSNQYFPLADEYASYDDFTIYDFIRQIPVDLMGFTWDDYEEFNSYRDGFILLLSMVESPFDSNERVPLLERATELVGKSLAELIPAEGWSVADLHRKFDGSEYEGLATFADWIHSETGCWQLDANYLDYGGEDWSRRIVDGLTADWPRVQEIQNEMHHMYEWLEEDLQRNFQKLLAAMLDVEFECVPKEQIPFPLDNDGQVIRKEV